MKSHSALFWWTLLVLIRGGLAVDAANCTLSAIAKGNFDQDCDILCKSAEWTDLASFYIGNYIAHVATIRSPPGQGTFGSIATVALALFFPTFGLFEGVRAISSLAILGKTPLQSAARAGALYAVVEVEKARDTPEHSPTHGPEGSEHSGRSQSRSARQSVDSQDVELQHSDVTEQRNDSTVANESGPAHKDGDIEARRDREVKNIFGLLGNFLMRHGFFKRKIHGHVSLPSGWKLIEVPWTATFDDDDATSTSKKAEAVQLSQDYSITKSAIALGQTLYAISTLYSTRGNQIQQFGYASFGFTVIPYAFMSIMNLVGNLVCPEYPAMYVVESDELKKLRDLIASGGNESKYWVKGTVGRLKAPFKWQQGPFGPKTTAADRLSAIQGVIYFFAISALTGIHVGLISGMTKFHKQNSTHAQRVWMMTWLGLGNFIGYGLGVYQYLIHSRELSLLMSTILGVYYFALAVGGFVVVGQMIFQLGVCEQI